MNPTNNIDNGKSIGKYFADVFSYPSSNYGHAVMGLEKFSQDLEKPIMKIQEFNKFIQKASVSEVEELFTNTFDMNPDTCLELGWHLYGESYQRGEFMVKMRQELTRAGVVESVELPDHLSHCLLLLESMDKSEATQMVENIIMPAVSKVKSNLKDDNPYGDAITALLEYFNWNYQILEEVQ